MTGAVPTGPRRASINASESPTLEEQTSPGKMAEARYCLLVRDAGCCLDHVIDELFADAAGHLLIERLHRLAHRGAFRSRRSDQLGLARLLNVLERFRILLLGDFVGIDRGFIHRF